MVPLMLNTLVIVLFTMSVVLYYDAGSSNKSSTRMTMGAVNKDSSTTTAQRFLADTNPDKGNDDEKKDEIDFDFNPFETKTGSNDGPHFDDDTTRTETCKSYLLQFLNGTTDARDICQGMYNAFNEADCEHDGHHTTLPAIGGGGGGGSGKLPKISWSWITSIFSKLSFTSYEVDRDYLSVDHKHNNSNGTLVDDDVVMDDYYEKWECCDGIRTYYENHCEAGVGNNDSLQSTRLLGIMLVLLVCTILKAMMKKCNAPWLPDACIFILVGAIVGGIMRLVLDLQVVQDRVLNFDTDLFLQILLPPIIFQAALSIDKRAFRRDLFPILSLASFGTAFSAIAIGYITHTLSRVWNAATTIPLLDSLVFGSLISSIDPVATLSILSSVGVSQTDTLYTLIFGESLLNDGVAIVLFDTLKTQLGSEVELDEHMVHHLLKHFLVLLSGSIGIGLVSGMACTIYFWALRGRQSAVTEVMIFFCWALIPYYVAEAVECSGIISIMVMGFMLDYYVIGGFQSEETSWMDYMAMRNGGGGTGSANGGASGHNNANTVSFNAMSPHYAPPAHQQYSGGPPPPGMMVDQWTQFQHSWGSAFSGRGHILSRSRHHVGFVAEVIASLMDTAIFAYLGLFLFNDTGGWYLRLDFIAILGCVSSRAVMIIVLSLLINIAVFFDLERFLGKIFKVIKRNIQPLRQGPQHASSHSLMHNGTTHTQPQVMVSSRSAGSQIDQMLNDEMLEDHDDDSLASTTRTYLDQRTQIILLLSGIRGAVSFALVENIPIWDAVSKTGSLYKPELKAMTSCSIVFTLFVFGALTYFVVQGSAGRRGSRVAGPLTHRLLSEPLDSGGEEETEDFATENGSTDFLEIERPGGGVFGTPHRPQQPQHQYHRPEPAQYHPSPEHHHQQYHPVPNSE